MPRSRPLTTCALAWSLVACSSGDATAPQDGVDAGAVNDASSDSSAASESGGGADGASDSGRTVDAHAPAPPSCSAGDRSEWSGVISNTLIAVTVCSACGESYVVSANGGASAVDVTVENGTSTITSHVPAGGMTTTGNLADNRADGTVTVCATSGARQCLPVSPVNQRYCNPVRAVTGLRPERIDQGVDYGGAGAIYAIGPGKIDLYQNRNDTGWPGGTFVSYKLTAGPAAGKTIYLAENIDLNPALHAGAFVFSGTVLGTLVNASPDSEMGWGVEGAGYTAEHACYTEGCNTALGKNFNDLLVCLKAPSGVAGVPGCCPSSAGYPADWCALLATWQ